MAKWDTLQVTTWELDEFGKNEINPFEVEYDFREFNRAEREHIIYDINKRLKSHFFTQYYEEIEKGIRLL